MNASLKKLGPPVRNIAIISDLLLWGVLLLGVAGALYFFGVMQPAGHQQTIRLPFQDANEITRGAMVRMMGVDIGYVHEIRLKQNYVDIVVKTYPDSIPIPSGSTFTVLFTGIAGSKSIEVVTPEAARPYRQGKPVYIVENPIRLRQALQYQIDISEALKKGADNFADFFGKKRPVEELQYNILLSRDATDVVRQKALNAQAVVIAKEKEFNQTLQAIQSSVSDFGDAGGRAATILDSHYLAPSTYATLRYFGLLFAEGEASMLSFQNRQGFQRSNRQILQMGKRLRQLAVAPVLLQAKPRVVQLDQRLRSFRMGVDRMQGALDAKAYAKLQQVRQRVAGWKQQSEQLNQRF